MNLIQKFKNYYYKLYGWSGVDVVLIVSTGRTGTNFLANYFSKNYSGAYSVHEPMPDLFDLSMSKFREKSSNHDLEKKLLMNRYGQYKKLKEEKKKIYLESNPNLSFLLPEAIKMFKKPKIVFITRDIKSYIISAYNKSPNNTRKMFFYGENDHRKRLTPNDVNDIVNAQKWEKWERIEKIAWFYSFCNEYIYDSLKSYPHCRVKFENLFGKNGADKLTKIENYLNLPNIRIENKTQHLDKKKNFNQFKILKSFEEISSDSRKNIDQLANNISKKLGY